MGKKNIIKTLVAVIFLIGIASLIFGGGAVFSILIKVIIGAGIFAIGIFAVCVFIGLSLAILDKK